MKIARIAIDVPLHQLFDYCGDGVDSGDIGCLALVPFGGHNTLGVIVELAGTSDVPAARLKKIIRVLRDAPALRGDDLDLMRFAAAYYHYALGATIVGTLPARLRRRETRNVEPLAFALTAEGAAVAMEDLPQRAAVQRRLLAYMRERQQVDEMAIRRLAPSARAALKTFAAKGWVTRVQSIPPARSTSDRSVPPPYELTNEQAAAAAAIRSELDRFAPFVLFGVTGSGKTEVYLYAMEAVLRSGRQILYLVPEIGLTPQLETAIRQRFPATSFVALHSGLNETERFTHWRAAHAGEARIVLGTRLAVFAPMPQLGLIIVDEEHDASFKQFDALRYSARDLAVVRARQRGIPIVLGSATPALETYHNAVSGRYRLLMLRQRINATPPHIECVNTRGERLSEAGLSARLLAKVEACLERKEQILVFLNRRGFAPVVMCQACSWLSRCHRCSANLVLHRAEHQLRCHHCGHTARIPAACPNCGSQELHPVGHGTQRIEAALRGHFPRARILRIDRDSTRRKTAWPAMRQEIVTREVDILIGTQILAKGHDFPHLSLVGVLNADSLLYSADIRASERLYGLLTQVAGRAGRGETPGEVMIQTDFPNHPLYRALQEQDYESFARALLEERQAAGFPPYVYQALLRSEASRIDAALDYLARAARIGRHLSTHVTIYDPVPAAMPRVAGRERAQLLVQSESRAQLQQFLDAWHARLSAERWGRARWSLDVDPLEL